MQREPTHEEQEALCRSIGLGIWHLQHLEYALHILLTIKVDLQIPGSASISSAQAAFDDHARKTLGAALQVARRNGALPEELQRDMEKFLEERNWLVHRSIEEHTEGMYNDEGRGKAMARLGSFAAEAQRLKKVVVVELTAYVREHGVEVAEAETRARATVARLSGKA